MYKTIEAEVDLFDFDTEELIDELKHRARKGDKEAAAAFGAKEPDPNQDDLFKSGAEALSDLASYVESVTPQDVLDAAGVGSMAVNRAIAQRTTRDKAN